ncbi:hypothetical protein FA13DRAFT_1642615 [Coprinellus micaceus]|uniref:DUF6532 domain-containing protein n=1 Tax=Coprinellus micaceus TaxID=71717 RepID=A0A4Y7SII1_COPMI|nr:hypothetical protein FA13DRAFT_1642615 [Coprinellus micaceus]
MWFKKRSDEGPQDPAFSRDNSIPLPTIALVFTAIEAILDNWVTGEWKDSDFSAEVYRPKFDRHLWMLKDFEVKTSEAKILPRLRTHLLTKARKHAKVEEPSRTASTSTTIDYAAAMADWEGNVLSDGENGDGHGE